MAIRAIIDDKSVRHFHCHGVSVDEWYNTIKTAWSLLSSPEYRAHLGITKVSPSARAQCVDPDCRRLNRVGDGRPKTAMYWLTRDLPRVRPSSDNPEELRLCQGHPYKAGSYLCRTCMLVATAKRYIDARSS